MFKRGGFASYTKTGRRMQFGAAVGESLARGTRSRGSKSSSEELGICGYILYIILILLLIDQITKATNKYLAQ
jgi:hypothetical protein